MKIITGLSILGLTTFSLLTSCSAKPELDGYDAEDLGGTGEKAPITTALEDRASEARKSEGKISVGALLRGQQANHLINGKFGSSLEELEIPLSSDNYDFQFEDIDTTTSLVKAIAKNDELQSYVGGIVINDEIDFKKITIICESEKIEVSNPSWNGTEWACGEASKPVD